MKYGAESKVCTRNRISAEYFTATQSYLIGSAEMNWYGGCWSCTIFWAQISPKSIALNMPFHLVLLWQSDERGNIKMVLLYPLLTAVTTFILHFSLHTIINYDTCLLDKTLWSFHSSLQYLMKQCCFSHLSWYPFGKKPCRIPLWTYHHCISKSMDRLRVLDE